jgi:hypothetical protein
VADHIVHRHAGGEGNSCQRKKRDFTIIPRTYTE